MPASARMALPSAMPDGLAVDRTAKAFGDLRFPAPGGVVTVVHPITVNPGE